MDKVIGLGKSGCAIVEELTSYPEYRVYKIDSKINERASLSLGSYADMEQYEKNLDKDEVSIYLRSIKPGDDVLLVVEGGDPVAGAALGILECIRDANIHVAYVLPDRTMISQVAKRDDKISFNVFQQYARSGIFEKLFLINKLDVENLMGDVPVQEYEKRISYFIGYVIAMINYFDHIEPKIANKIETLEHCRIVTFGLSSLDDKGDETQLLFPLEGITDIHFYYGIPVTDVAADSGLMKKIKNHVKKYASPAQSVSFSVYETTFEQQMILCVAYSHKIQSLVGDLST